MSSGTRRALLALKSLLALAVVAAVAWQFAKLIDRPELFQHAFQFRWQLLLPAGLLYLCCHIIWGTFWVQLLWGQGVAVTWPQAMRAYFFSQLAKYVPGKAWVIVVRVALLRKHGASSSVVAFTATYETLTSMAGGALLAVTLLPKSGLIRELPGYAWIGLCALAALPLAAGAIHALAARMLAKKRGPDAKPLPSPRFRLLLRGLVQDLFGWLLLGASLWLTVAGLSADIPDFTLAAFLEDVSAVAMSYVAGFLAFVMPGGAGVRELALQGILAEQLKPAEGDSAAPLAAVVALVLRLIWTSFEVVVSLAAGLFRPKPVDRSAA